MPEYLSPDVYVEEIDTGSKPIEGVSTSTAGVLGVTERGPANVPILVTSYGEYTRWFGERLDPAQFPAHCYLPHAVEGFFTNGGKRLYVSRIEAQGATRASFDIGNRGSITSARTRLLRPAPEASGLSGSPIYVLNVGDTVYPNSGTLADGDRIRIGSGSETEYRIAATVTGAAFHVGLALPLQRAHASGSSIFDVKSVAGAAPNSFALGAAASRGGTAVTLSTPPANVAVDDLLEIDAGTGLAEFRFVLAVSPASAGCTVKLDAPLSLEHANGTAVNKLNPKPGGTDEVNNFPLDTAAVASGGIVFLTPTISDFTDRTQIAIVDRDNDHTQASQREARRIGKVGALAIQGAFATYATGSVVAGVTTAPGSAMQLTAPALAHAVAITVNDRTALALGNLLLIGTAPTQELAIVKAMPTLSPIAPNAGVLVLDHPLQNAYPVNTTVQQMSAPALRADRPATSLLLDVSAGDTILPVGDGGDGADLYAAGDIVRITTADDRVFYHALTAGTVACDPHPVVLSVAVERPHTVGSEIAERGALLQVQALDSGVWGNRLRLMFEDEQPGLVSRTPVMTAIAANRIRVGSLTGIEAGSVLEIVDASGQQLGDPVKVQSVDRATGELLFDAVAPLSASQFATLLGALPASYQLRSREFKMTVLLLRQPDPTLPSRNGQVLDREVFRFLSMDPRHSRYVETIVGDINGTPRLSDHRPDGESWYVRVSDDNPVKDVRLGPETLVDRLPDGRSATAQHPLDGADDAATMFSDSAYIGTDDVNPENRTGLYSLGNVDEISIVSCPGQTSATLQGALIAHCENYRYRVAILDGPAPPDDSIDDVRTQRQQFDSKYAALYHPWLLVPQPFPASAATPPEFAIPPSGHVVGVIARTDIDRGVHKAPANEVVLGILGLQRVLNRDQQDLLNPYPININVIRDFRPESRGIRVYGGRCITSDSDWKYLNVRRLLIFIEKSINIGLQWVVFEPNAEELWARVRRSIASFLTLTWRNGALEGTKPEEAFFVKCDRTTMTQTDLDEGRLICYVGVAPVKPAEFVIIRIGLWTANADQ